MDMEKNKSLKKVSIITIIDNVNFGTYLQALALAKTIENLHFSPILLIIAESIRVSTIYYTVTLQVHTIP